MIDIPTTDEIISTYPYTNRVCYSLDDIRVYEYADGSEILADNHRGPFRGPEEMLDPIRLDIVNRLARKLKIKSVLFIDVKDATDKASATVRVLGPFCAHNLDTEIKQAFKDEEVPFNE